ncbi:MAG TPA: GtrA family protein [Thermomicrobiales bacterium]
MSTESWPQPAVRLWTLAQRFQKFLVVGAFGLAVNQGLLFVFHDLFGLRLSISSPTAIAISMAVTFALNERWTWHDRGSGPILHRLFMYCPINTVGLLINFGVLALLVQDFDVHYLLANLVGAGLAAVWNFSLNNLITWRT